MTKLWNANAKTWFKMIQIEINQIFQVFANINLLFVSNYKPFFLVQIRVCVQWENQRSFRMSMRPCLLSQVQLLLYKILIICYKWRPCLLSMLAILVVYSIRWSSSAYSFESIFNSDVEFGEERHCEFCGRPRFQRTFSMVLTVISNGVKCCA